LTARWLPLQQLDVLFTGGFQEGFAKVGGKYDKYLDDIQHVSAIGSVTWKAIESWLEFTPQAQYLGRRAGLGDALLLHAHARSTWKNYSVGIAAKNLSDERYASPEQQRRLIRTGAFTNAPRSFEFVLAAEF
jgi:hypothetical protein